MTAMEQLFLILELVGTLAFAASGAITGLKKNMDVFGVCILGLTTAVGGGVIRSGAGIVADSVPESEYQECINKAQAVVNAVKASEGGLD